MRPRYFAYLILVVLYEDTPPPRNGTYQIISAVPMNQQEVHRDRVHFNVWYFVSCFLMLERRRPHHVNYIHFSIA